MGVNNKVNVLLVDDQPARLLTYESILSELGQNLVSANSGLEALEKLMKDEFAVVLLDVSMPDMDGFEAATLIHQHPRFEKTPIIFVTGVHISELDRLKGYKVGAVDYVSIPVVPEILRSKVAVLVELHLKRRELQELNRTLGLANERLAQANTTLQVEKTRELETLNRVLQRANQELESANRSLQTEVTERTRVELALKEADRHKDEFLAMLAHELRNPLAPIHNAVALMHRSPLADPQLVWSRDVIGRQLAHLTRLVDDLLDVSRITRGKININKEVLALGTLVARTVETVQPLFEQRGHLLTVEIPDGAMAVLGDPTRLMQALGNVLGNAAKYTERGGRIALSAIRVDSEVEIRVRDNGIGIPPDLMPMIFNLFTQLDRTSGPAQSGLGIGLALVQRLVEMHGGSVTAYSEGPARGSEFVIRLPLFIGESSGPEQHQLNTLSALEQSMNEGNTRTQRRILVADDNNDALESLATLLQLSGHQVYTAANGALALESAEANRPEVALLDIGMPKLDGYEVARRIRAQPWGARITLVALTGWGQDSDRKRSQEAGFDSHLVKPLDLDKLTELLASLPTADAPAAAKRG
jgi:signal transduction histidine kinase